MITFSSLLSSLPEKEAVEGTSQLIPNYKRKHPSHMKASLLIHPSSIITLPFPKCFYSDDIHSNHWVMSLTDIKSSAWRCKRKADEELTPWIGGVMEKRTSDIFFCSPTSETLWETAGAVQLLAPSDYWTTFGN